MDNSGGLQNPSENSFLGGARGASRKSICQLVFRGKRTVTTLQWCIHLQLLAASMPLYAC